MELSGITLAFDEADLKTARRWWEKMNYSAADDEEVLLSAMMRGIITMDIVDQGEIYNN
jgi:uncharacterized protein